MLLTTAELQKESINSSDYSWQLRFTYRIFTPATFRSSLDAFPTVFGIGINALIPLWMENKERKESKVARVHQSPCKVSSQLSPLCLHISSSGTLCGSMVIGDRGNIQFFPLSSMLRDAKVDLWSMTSLRLNSQPTLSGEVVISMNCTFTMQADI